MFPRSEIRSVQSRHPGWPSHKHRFAPTTKRRTAVAQEKGREGTFESSGNRWNASFRATACGGISRRAGADVRPGPMQWPTDHRRHEVPVSASNRQAAAACVTPSASFGRASSDEWSENHRAQEAAGTNIRGKSRPDRASSPSTPRKRSEEHTSELQSPCNLVCRLLLEK